jgi:hypothetical protein
VLPEGRDRMKVNATERETSAGICTVSRMFGSSQRGELQSLADLGQQDLGKELEFGSWDINTAEITRDEESLQVAGMKEEAAI